MSSDINVNSVAPLGETRESIPSFEPAKVTQLALPRVIDWSLVATLMLLIVIGLGLRLPNLGAIGFAEDEMNKLDAVHAYARGDITANGEHPMLMKALMFASIHGAKRLSENISEETALRFPNALIGALTAIPLFLLTAALFDRWTGLLAAALWTTGVNAITFNRIGKEDTLLVFFMLFGFYFYIRAKQTSPALVSTRKRHYVFSAAAFGLMIASKYFPHYFGLNQLYHHNFHVRKAQPGEPSGKTPQTFYLLIIVFFLLANPAVLLPQVWSYMNSYMAERLLVHSGYLFAGHLYKNNMSATPFWGTPIYFYLVFLAIKLPLLIVGSFIAGLIVAFKSWRHSGHSFVLLMFLFWIVPYSLMGGKWLRYTLSLMPLVYMLAAIGVMAGFRFLRNRYSSPGAGSILAGAAVVLFILIPAWQAYAHRPHFALYTNALASNRAGFYFPHDEFYDDGLREAIQFVCQNAPTGATLGHETPAATRYYLRRFGRTDLNSRAISSPDFDPGNLSGPAYFVLQRGRTYFENQEKLKFIRSNFAKVHEIYVDGIVAAEIYVKIE